MEYRNLGRTGLKVSVFSFGSWVTFGNQVPIRSLSLPQTRSPIKSTRGALRELRSAVSTGAIAARNDNDLRFVLLLRAAALSPWSHQCPPSWFRARFDALILRSVDVELAKRLLRRCYEAGVNFFDNAEVYANGKAEEIFGQAVRELGWRRSEIVVSTKIFWGGQGVNEKGLSRKHIVEGVRASLRRLGMEYVDLLYCHRPDASTPIEETVRAMNHVIDKGWAFYWGTSEWSAAQITEACEVARRLNLIGPAMEQPEYNLIAREKVEKEFLPLYEPYGLGLTTWSPLASGVLTGKYARGHIPPDSRFALANYKHLATRKLVEEVLDKVGALQAVAGELQCTVAQLSLAWCAKNPHVSSVITGSTKESQIEENMKALEVMPKLTPAVMERIDAIMRNKPKLPDSFR
ncbi:unnamed protein product [Closterium sp. Naga37s-1]|nr:unnamed protein product [Closterium sp. Naga37s-1]